MKRFFSFLAASAMLFAMSCAEDKVGTNNGDEAQVVFNLGLEGQSGTRAIGDATTVTDLYYQVFDENGEALSLTPEPIRIEDEFSAEDRTAAVALSLLKGRTYKIAFWAQHKESQYEVGSGMVIDANYDLKVASNNEKRDAFFAVVDSFKPGDRTDITLRRPFAQLNVGVFKSDWDAAVSFGVIMSKSKVVIGGGLYNTFNLMTGTFEDEVDNVEFSLAEIPAETLNVDVDGDTLVVDDEKFVYLSMNYMFVGNNESTKNISANYTFQDVTGTNEVLFDLATVPVQYNHRTNILGRILTGTADFQVTIDEKFDMPDNEKIYPTAFPCNEVELILALKYADELGHIITLTGDIELNKSLNVTADSTVLRLNGHNMTVVNYSDEVGKGEAIIVQTPGAKLTIEGEGTVTANTRVVCALGNDNGIEITIKGGKYVGAYMASDVIYASGTNHISIQGGEFEALTKSNDEYLILNDDNKDSEDPNIICTGGIFKNFDPQKNESKDYVKYGYTVLHSEEGEDEYHEVKLITEAWVANETELLAALENQFITTLHFVGDGFGSTGIAQEYMGGTMINNVYKQQNLVINGNNIPIDNGVTTKANYGLTFYAVPFAVTLNDLVIMRGGGLQVQDANVVFNSGEIHLNHRTNGGVTNQRYAFNVGGASTVTINGGTFTLNGNGRQFYIAAWQSSVVYVKGGNFGVEDAVANPVGRHGSAIITGGTAQVIITGGTFGFDPSHVPLYRNNASDTADEIYDYANYVAEGYKAVYNDNDKTWKVVKADDNE